MFKSNLALWTTLDSPGLKNVQLPPSVKNLTFTKCFRFFRELQETTFKSQFKPLTGQSKKSTNIQKYIVNSLQSLVFLRFQANWYLTEKMKEKPRFKWMEVSVTELNSFENIYFHFLWNVWLCAKSTKEWKRKREFVKISCLEIHWSFFSFELATLAFSDFSYKNIKTRLKKLSVKLLLQLMVTG